MQKPLFSRFLTLGLVSFILCGDGTAQADPETGGNQLGMKINGTEWRADHNLFGAFHPPGLNKALLIGGSKGPKNEDEQVLTLNVFNVEGPGTYHIKTGNADLSVAQLANLSPENFMYGSMTGFDLTVIVTQASKDPAVIEATFEGTLTGNGGDTLKITDGRFSYRE